jgi:hypothetical protein
LKLKLSIRKNVATEDPEAVTERYGIETARAFYYSRVALLENISGDCRSDRTPRCSYGEFLAGMAFAKGKRDGNHVTAIKKSTTVPISGNLSCRFVVIANGNAKTKGDRKDEK